MRILLSFLIISIILCSCDSSETNDKIKLEIDKSQNSNSHSIDSKQIKDTFKIYLDTLNQIESRSLSFDTLSFSQFYDIENSYNLIYHETGKIKNGDKQFGLSIFSVNDTTIRVKLLKKNLSKWTICDTINLYGIRFSPAMFSPIYSDFNQNGTNDILLVFYQSMSVAYSHGYLILFSKESEKLVLIENSIDIPNLEVVNNKITSITYNHPGHEPKEYTKTNEYKITDNQLMLINSNKEYKN